MHPYNCPTIEDYVENKEVLAIAEFIRYQKGYSLTLERVAKLALFFYKEIKSDAGKDWIVKLEKYISAI